MEYTKEDLIEAKRQIDSTLHKLRETIITFYKCQVKYPQFCSFNYPQFVKV